MHFDHAEDAKRIRVIRIFCQDVSAKPRRRVDVAALQVCARARDVVRGMLQEVSIFRAFHDARISTSIRCSDSRALAERLSQAGHVTLDRALRTLALRFVLSYELLMNKAYCGKLCGAGKALL
ncbi:MAG: hypothetical protein AB7K86_12790 [Rhodospirillales bacterium]